MNDGEVDQLLNAITDKLEQHSNRRQALKAATIGIVAMALLKDEGKLHALAAAQLHMLLQEFDLHEQVAQFVSASKPT